MIVSMTQPITRDSDQEIKVVCFDLGGVIVRIHRTWADTCLAAGFEIRGNADQQVMTDRRRAITKLMATGEIEPDEWAARLSETLDGLYEPEEILAIHYHWLIEEYPSIGEVIEMLNGNGFRTVCLSNTNALHWPRLVHVNDDDQARHGEVEFPSILLLQEHYASHRLGFQKPDEEIYREFESRVGCTGSEILFFDDLPENVETAQRLDWRVGLIDPAGDPASQIRERLCQFGLFGVE